jgi:hypothetical protein
MKERPILFSSEMVRAILSGHKTQTRRILKWQPIDILSMNVPNQWCTLDTREPDHGSVMKCRFGIPGDRLWVRETWAKAPHGYVYKANFSGSEGSEVIDIPTGDTCPLIWKPSLFMPRVVSRITLEIVNVRVERIQDISEKDAEAEGIHLLGLPIEDRHNHPRKHIAAFKECWNLINAKKGFGWDINPWVWVIEFKKL